MRCNRRLLNDHVTNGAVCDRIRDTIRVSRRAPSHGVDVEMIWYGHESSSSGMSKIVLQGTVKEDGMQKKHWKDDSKEWTSVRFGDLVRTAEYTER